ncbi:MAG: zinc ribbon domain-containing protein [Halobacteriota archaeon]
MSSRSKRCSSCGESIPTSARICPNCKTLQPSNLLVAGAIALGVFCLLFGVPIALFSVGLGQLFGFLLAVCGLALIFGGYTSYLDRQAGRDL